MSNITKTVSAFPNGAGDSSGERLGLGTLTSLEEERPFINGCYLVRRMATPPRHAETILWTKRGGAELKTQREIDKTFTMQYLESE